MLEKDSDLAVQLNLLLGTCYNRLENPVGMLDAYNRVLKDDPNSPAALLGVAVAQWKLGQIDNSLDNYKALMKQQVTPPNGWLDIARIEVQKQLHADRAGRRWEEATAAVERAEAGLPQLAAPDRPARRFDVNLLRAEILAAQDRAEEAERLLTEARDMQPREQRAQYWVALVELAEFRKDRARARALLAEAEAHEQDAVDLRLARARQLAADKPADLTARLDALAGQVERFPDEDQARLFAGLAEIQYRAGNAAQARGFCLRLAANPLHRSDLRLRLFVFDLALKESNDAAIAEAVQGIEAVEQRTGDFTHFATALTIIRKARQAPEKSATSCWTRPPGSWTRWPRPGPTGRSWRWPGPRSSSCAASPSWWWRS